MSVTPRAMPALQNEYAVRQGADATVRLRFHDVAGEYVDLTGYTMKAQIRAQKFEDSVRGEKVADWVIDESELASGTFVLTLSPTETAGLVVGHYLWDALMKRPDDYVLPFVPNLVSVVPGVTEPPV